MNIVSLVGRTSARYCAGGLSQRTEGNEQRAQSVRDFHTAAHCISDWHPLKRERASWAFFDVRYRMDYLESIMNDPGFES